MPDSSAAPSAPKWLSRVPLAAPPLAKLRSIRDGRWLARKLLKLIEASEERSLVMMKRLGWVCRCAVSALVALVALGAIAEAKTFRWSNDGDPTTMDPHARSDGFVTSFDMNMYEPLLRRDRDLTGCGKSRDFKKTAMTWARCRNYDHFRSMGYGRAPVDEWQPNDDQPTFSAAC